jgi:hypothetical protein
MKWAGDGEAAGDQNRGAVAALTKGGDTVGRVLGLDNRSRRPFYSNACGGNTELAVAGIAACACAHRASRSEQGGSER